MALADRLEDTPKRHTGTPCSVGALEDFLQGKEADSFYAMLHTLGWSGARVYAAIQAEAKELYAAAAQATEAGDEATAKAKLAAAVVHANMGEQTVNRHRSRGCRCFK